jgi:hypothetical protein
MTQPAGTTIQNPYGIDFWIGPNATGQLDADPSMRTTTGRGLLSQSLLCRQTTPRGSVVDCPNDCLDIRDMVSSGMTQAQITALASQIQQELLKDQRVSGAIVTATFSNATSTLTITEQIQSGYGPFTLVLAVTSLTVKILDANLPTQ